VTMKSATEVIAKVQSVAVLLICPSLFPVVPE
jgi:hypothetical protein